MTQELIELSPTEHAQAEVVGALPFPFNQQTYCRYEPIEQRIDEARVLVVDNLLRDERDLSPVAIREWGSALAVQLKRERLIAGMAIENILNNIARLVKRPITEVAHLSELAEAASKFNPEAIVLSGTLRDFDYYQQPMLDGFASFIQKTKIPVLAICGGHQLVGLSFGARVVTLDKLEQHEQREDRPHEYQYRFIRITSPSDPIFAGINTVDDDVIRIVKDRVDQSGFVKLGEDMKQGDRVVIKAGPLREFEGIFERKLKDNERITVLLTTISYQGRLVINKDLIEKVNAHHA